MLDDLSNVTRLDSYKESRGEHQSGEAKCVACGHSWVAVAPIGAHILTCPKCDVQRGYFRAIVERIDDLHWKCNCGNFLFFVTKEGVYCPCCGDWQRGF